MASSCGKSESANSSAISIARSVSSKPGSARRRSLAAASASRSDAPSVSARISTASTPPVRAPVGWPWVSAANSVPSRKASWGESYCRRRQANRPTGATRMTPPQPLLSLRAGSPSEFIARRADRQVLPGARRLCS